MSVTRLIARFLQHVRTGSRAPIHPDVKRISDLMPPDVDAKEYASQFEVAERIMREDREVLRKLAE